MENCPAGSYIHGMTYSGEIQLKGYLRYYILLKDNQTYRTLLSLMILV